MTHTYRGTKVEHEWMPLAMANGVEDGRFNMRDGNLYRTGRANRVLYRVGFWLGRYAGVTIA